MHILENIKREMEFNDSHPYSWETLIEMSLPSLHNPSLILFDPNNETLYNPESMILALSKLINTTDIGVILASAYASLAQSYASTIEKLEKITHKSYPVIHIIGGGARNDHLNQMTADRAHKKVIAGPVEATSLGIAAIQILHNHPLLTLKEVRKIIKNSSELFTYTPNDSLS
jgi:sugar (pentulose or hexulose) kinase